MKAELLKNGVLCAQVCSDGSYDETLEWIRKNNPAGTENNWGKAYRDGQEPVKCADNPEHTHFIFSC